MERASTYLLSIGQPNLQAMNWIENVMCMNQLFFFLQMYDG